MDVEYALAQKLEIFDFHVCATPLSSTVICKKNEIEITTVNWLLSIYTGYFKLGFGLFVKAQCFFINLLFIHCLYILQNWMGNYSGQNMGKGISNNIIGFFVHKITYLYFQGF